MRSLLRFNEPLIGIPIWAMVRKDLISLLVQGQGVHMEFEEFFTIAKSSSEGVRDSTWGQVSVKPTESLEKLPPHKAIAELQTFVDGLKDVLEKYHQSFTEEDLEIPENFAKVRKVVFERDVAHSYLDYLKKHYTTKH